MQAHTRVPVFAPVYLSLLKNGMPAERASAAWGQMEGCDLCARYCHFDYWQSRKGVACRTTEQVLAFVTTEVSTSTDLNLMEQYHPCYSAWENPPLDRPPRAGEFETAMAIAATHGLHRIDRRRGHRYPASSLQHPNE